MAIDYRKRPKTAPARGPAISLAKLRTAAVELVPPYESARVSLEKRGLTGQRAAVYLVLDRSGSMRQYYQDGTMQRLAEQALALSANLDDDGVVPVVFFSTGVDGVADLSIDDYTGRIAKLHQAYGHMGRTNYHLAMQAVIDHYTASGATDPALVIFQTDGGPSSRAAAEHVLCTAARLPIFWQFIGFGNPDNRQFDFLRRLDELPVPDTRVVDNAGFFAVGTRPADLSYQALYDALTAEFPDWLAAARRLGIVR